MAHPMAPFRPCLVALAVLALPGVPAWAQTADLDQASGTLDLSASFTPDGAPVRSGLRWRVFGAQPDASGTLPVAAQSDEAAPILHLPPGSYMINAEYGLATMTRRVEVGSAPASQRLVLNAGALKVEATVGGQPLPASKLKANLYTTLPSGDRHLVASNVPAVSLIRLPEGAYTVECAYGDTNAVVSAEITVKAGQVTEATFHQLAATMTLKLVNQPGGEALANTSWSVLTPGGDVIREAIGAFPPMILAEGSYTVVARHDGRVYQREFEVRSGLDQDVEVLAQ